jgi:hypothetical protein
VLELGRAPGLAGTAVGEIQERLTAVAAASGAKKARIVVLPTVLLVSLERGEWTTIEATPQLGDTLRLEDQNSALYVLVEEAERGKLGVGPERAGLDLVEVLDDVERPQASAGLDRARRSSGTSMSS